MDSIINFLRNNKGLIEGNSFPICKFCQEIPMDPVVTPCHCVWCFVCLSGFVEANDNPHCPQNQCQSVVLDTDSIFRSPAVEKAIKATRVRCSFPDCNSTLMVSNAMEHRNTHPAAVVTLETVVAQMDERFAQHIANQNLQNQTAIANRFDQIIANQNQQIANRFDQIIANQNQPISQTYGSRVTMV